jgi:DNA-binding transcriptional regulator YdaS (Cro superfamily)
VSAGAGARYRWIDPADLVHVSPAEVAKYASERRRFDAEVAEHVEHAAREGWIDVGASRPVPFRLSPDALTRLRAAADLARSASAFLAWLFRLARGAR